MAAERTRDPRDRGLPRFRLSAGGGSAGAEPYDLAGHDVPMLVLHGTGTTGAHGGHASDGARMRPWQVCTSLLYDGARHGLPCDPPRLCQIRRSRASTKPKRFLARYLPVTG